MGLRSEARYLTIAATPGCLGSEQSLYEPPPKRGAGDLAENAPYPSCVYQLFVPGAGFGFSMKSMAAPAEPWGSARGGTAGCPAPSLNQRTSPCPSMM